MDNGVSIDVDTTLYSARAVMRAAYRFSGGCFVAVTRHPTTAQQLIVRLRAKDEKSVDTQNLTSEFWNELLDQQVREGLEAEFGPIRELIVAQAFADANLLDGARDQGDYLEDPLGIGADTPGPHVASSAGSGRTGATEPAPSTPRNAGLGSAADITRG
jgi:His-Xaa-Ser system protein HxsD